MADTIPSFRSYKASILNYATRTEYDTLLGNTKQETHSVTNSFPMEKSVSESLIADAQAVAVEAARNAGVVLRQMLFHASVREKGPKDLVTDADLAAQAIIEGAIKKASPSMFSSGGKSR